MGDGEEEFWESEKGDKNQTFRKNFHIRLDRCGFRRINIKDRAVKNFVKYFLKIFYKKNSWIFISKKPMKNYKTLSNFIAI